MDDRVKCNIATRLYFPFCCFMLLSLLLLSSFVCVLVLFDMFDFDGTGKITREEMRSLIRSLSKHSIRSQQLIQNALSGHNDVKINHIYTLVYILLSYTVLTFF